MPIRKKDIKRLSADVRRIIDGQVFDLRDNREGVFSILKNDIHTLANLKNEQVAALKHDRDTLKNTLADISHQLKTPLTSMMIMAELLENAPPEKAAEFAANIKTSLLRMEWLVSALLKMAKLDAGAVEFSRESVKASALAKLALDPLQILLEIRNQRAEVAGDTDLLCDSRWTAEALSNLLKNASEYSPDGGVIRIESGKNPVCAWISVTDSGAGIPSEEITGLFRRFKGSRSDKGFGIGLPLALAIMRGQGGDVEINGGGNGIGATFTLKIYA
ncbi:MAG: HAMP domain-containing histidine kinase [Oscillospiraceae bacterium]|nr:HAMP domain-containing histidine kinase [Oscillospiraceae bacterium]